jgi:hypothetical protein
MLNSETDIPTELAKTLVDLTVYADGRIHRTYA